MTEIHDNYAETDNYIIWGGVLAPRSAGSESAKKITPTFFFLLDIWRQSSFTLWIKIAICPPSTAPTL